MAIDNEVYCTISLDRKGRIVEVRDARNQVKDKRTTSPEPARVGGKSPSGKDITDVSAIELVTVENEGDHDDPCWIKDRFGNWRCICPADLC